MKPPPDSILATLKLFENFDDSFNDSSDHLQLYVHGQDETVSSRMLELEEWEPTETACVLSLLHAGDLVVDVGANIGYYTLLCSRLVGEAGRVIALEPDNRNFQLLQCNVDQFGSDNISLMQKAAASKSQTMSLYRSASNFGDHRSYPNPDNKDEQTIEGIILDEILLGLRRPADLLKIDCQGAEADILQGMTRILENAELRPKAILLEFWPYGLTQCGSSAEGMLALIPGDEYDMWNLGPWDHMPRKTDPAELLELAAKEKNPRDKPFTFFTNLLLLRRDAMHLQDGITRLCEQKSSLRDAESVRLVK